MTWTATWDHINVQTPWWADPILYLWRESWSYPSPAAKPWVEGGPWGHGLTNSATTQAEIQSYELAHLISYPIYEPLEHMKGPLLWNVSQRISTSLYDSSILEKNLGEGLLLMVSQKAEAPNQTNDSSQIKAVWVKGCPMWQTKAPKANTTNEYVMESWERGRSRVVQGQPQPWLMREEAVIDRGTGRSPE